MQLMVALSFCLLALLPAGPPLRSSEWELVNPPAATAAVNAALDVAVADFNFLMRGFAREQLAKSVLPVSTTVIVDVDGPDVGLHWQGRPAVSGPLNTVFVGNPDGAGDARVLFLFDGTTLTQRATRDEGTRTTTVSLVAAPGDTGNTADPPAELVVVTRLEAKALAAPLVWTQRFRLRRRGG
jgi:hypothetical protein